MVMVLRYADNEWAMVWCFFCFGDGIFICLVFSYIFLFLYIWLHWQLQACAL